MPCVPEMTKSSENLKDELSKWSAVTGICSIVCPSNLYNPPCNDGIIRTHWPLFVSWLK